VAGYYDVKVREFYLADWLELDGQKPVMAHELTHALQDQHFNLKRFEKWPKSESDSELAVRALVEGDATLAMTIYMTRNPLEALAFTKSILSNGIAVDQINKAPRVMRESLIFPYIQGSEWATQLYKRGGWSLVSAAFTKLPLSTEQILHPEKYFSYEQPVKVGLPDVTNLLNAGRKAQTASSKQQKTSADRDAGFNAHSTTSQGQKSKPGTRRSRPRQVPASPATATPDAKPSGPPSWRRIDYDVTGEWGYYLILDQFLKAPADSKRAAAGWAGDRYALYEGPNVGDVFIAQMTVWDTDFDAREFFDTYIKRTELRYPSATAAGSLEPTTRNHELRNSRFEMQVHDSRTFQTGEGLVIIGLRGSRVLVLEGIPPGVDSNSLARALWP